MKKKLAGLLLALALIGGVAVSALAETRVGDSGTSSGFNPYPPYTQTGDK